MNFFRMVVGAIFNVIGLLVLYKGIKTTRFKGIAEGFLDIIIAIAFILIGLLIWNGYIS